MLRVRDTVDRTMPMLHEAGGAWEFPPDKETRKWEARSILLGSPALLERVRALSNLARE